ncbi:MAG: hypothetical protein ACLRMX_09920 [Lachnospira eligens]
MYSPYTTPADSTVKDNPNNNINSAGISVYADVSADSSLVYHDDNSDNQAVAHFKYSQVSRHLTGLRLLRVHLLMLM